MLTINGSGHYNYYKNKLNKLCKDFELQVKITTTQKHEILSLVIPTHTHTKCGTVKDMRG